jgi:hypothetical protein
MQAPYHFKPQVQTNKNKATKMTSLTILHYGCIRETEDGRYSVYDTIEVLAGKKNPRDAWKSLCEQYSEVVVKTDNFQFPGAGQRPTPVANKQNILYIIGLLPGAVGKAYREDAAAFMLEKLEGESESAQPKPIDDTPSIKQITEAVQAVLSIAGIHPNLIAGVAANAVCREYPLLTPTMEEARKALPLPTEDRLLTASELAQLYYERTGNKLTKLGTPIAEARAINKLLEQKGLQTKSSDNKQSWLATESSVEYSQIVLQTGKTNDGTYQQLRWLPSVVDLLV